MDILLTAKAGWKLFRVAPTFNAGTDLNFQAGAMDHHLPRVQYQLDTRSTTWTMNLLPMSRRLNREYEPMSRRLNREYPCEARGYIASGPTSNLPQLL